jgi:plasmid replication initiation protein
LINTKERGLVVRQSNTIIDASYKIASVGEGRLIRLLIAQIQPHDEDFKIYRIDVADFARFFDLPLSGATYELIEKSARALREREVFITNGKSWLCTGWLSHAEYKDGSGYVEVSFHKSLKPYLLQLQTHWNQYELKTIINFKSSYSIRIFELLKSWEFKADSNGYFKRSFEVDELRTILGLEKSEYKFFKDFRVYAIDQSVKEINANSDIRIIQVDYPKTGRKISHVVFHCEKPKQLQLEVDEKPPKLKEAPKEKEHPDYIAELIAIGIDENIAYRWKRKYTVARLRESIAYTKAMQKMGKIRDSVTGFLATTIANNMGASWVEQEKKDLEARKSREEKERQAQEKELERIEKQRKERDELRIQFDALPEEKKSMLRMAYKGSLSSIPLQTWERALKTNPKSPESVVMVSASFLSFYKQTIGVL